MSTSRKLLKIPRLNIPPLTLQKLPQKRAFKAVSDTEMLHVDTVAAVETLTTDVQTQFSEGKAKRIKENSPVKKNFEKMQTANIASSPRSFGIDINCESQLVIPPSGLISPSNAFSELAVEIGPEDVFLCSIGSPRDMTSPKVFKDNKNIEHSKKR